MAERGVREKDELRTLVRTVTIEYQVYIYIYIPGAYARTTPLEGLHQRDCCRVTPPLSLSLSIKQFNTLEHQEEMAHEKHAPRRN